MRIDGFWLLCEDGVVRPVIRGEVQAADGTLTLKRYGGTVCCL
jgi:hypothetical protein